MAGTWTQGRPLPLELNRATPETAWKDAMPPALRAAQASVPVPAVIQAIRMGMQKYTDIPVPILAIYAVPHDPGPAAGTDAAAAYTSQSGSHIAAGR